MLIKWASDLRVCGAVRQGRSRAATAPAASALAAISFRRACTMDRASARRVRMRESVAGTPICLGLQSRINRCAAIREYQGDATHHAKKAGVRRVQRSQPQLQRGAQRLSRGGMTWRDLTHAIVPATYIWCISFHHIFAKLLQYSVQLLSTAQHDNDFFIKGKKFKVWLKTST